jgi:hypothetical protein
MDLLDEHGSSIIFQVYRINLQAKAITELQGEKLVEIKVDGEFVSGTDTVAAVKEKVRRLLDGAGRPKNDAGAQPDLDMQKADRVTLVFNGHPMRDDKMFFADHCMLLPVWVQVFVHRCEFEEVTELARRLRHAASE